jgi:hypothetical protein
MTVNIMFLIQLFCYNQVSELYKWLQQAADSSVAAQFSFACYQILFGFSYTTASVV